MSVQNWHAVTVTACLLVVRYSSEITCLELKFSVRSYYSVLVWNIIVAWCMYATMYNKFIYSHTHLLRVLMFIFISQHVLDSQGLEIEVIKSVTFRLITN